MTPEERLESAIEYIEDRLEYHHTKYTSAMREAGDPDTVALGNEILVRAQVSSHNTCMGMAAEALKRLKGLAEVHDARGGAEMAHQDAQEAIVDPGAPEGDYGGDPMGVHPVSDPDFNQALAETIDNEMAAEIAAEVSVEMKPSGAAAKMFGLNKEPDDDRIRRLENHVEMLINMMRQRAED